jgi:hypothetical protein
LGVWGVLGMMMAFSWVSNILTIAAGAVAVSSWKTLQSTLRYFEKERGCSEEGRWRS